MSGVYVISDLHLGHKNILKFEPTLRFGDTVDEHDHILLERIRSVCPTKRYLLYILGDVCMDIERMEWLAELPCRKILVRGNHDNFKDEVYHKYFESIQGIIKYKGFWLSHAPVHPNELRGCKNIHGHVHSNSIRNNYKHELNPNYINACVENCNGYPINVQDIRDGSFEGVIK